MENQPLLRMTGIVKTFPGVRALGGVDLDVRAGEVHCLLGQNGAGKSTLIKVLAGAHRPDEGAISWNGEDVTLYAFDFAGKELWKYPLGTFRSQHGPGGSTTPSRTPCSAA